MSRRHFRSIESDKNKLGKITERIYKLRRDKKNIRDSEYENEKNRLKTELRIIRDRAEAGELDDIPGIDLEAELDVPSLDLEAELGNVSSLDLEAELGNVPSLDLEEELNDYGFGRKKTRRTRKTKKTKKTKKSKKNQKTRKSKKIKKGKKSKQTYGTKRTKK
jgi:hypothetical protein